MPSSPKRQVIVAMGGGGFSMEPQNPLLDDCILALTGKSEPRVCFLPTASGDSAGYIVRFYEAFQARNCRPVHLGLFHREHLDLREFLLSQDAIYVGGGNTANMLAVWRAHGVDQVLREAWQAGVVLCGISAGAVCWFEEGVTDSFGELAAIKGLGLLPGSHCPHYDSEPLRPSVYRQCIQGGMGPGFGVEDGVALIYAGTRLERIVSSHPDARAFHVEATRGEITETPLDPEFLGAPGQQARCSE